MNLWKLGALIAFGAVTGLCVNYAHSENVQPLEWKSAAWLGSCSLKAKHEGGSTWSFQATGHSRTMFNSFWPEKAGELWLTNGRKPMRDEPLVGGEPIEPDETLLIKFAMVDGKTEPVYYIFDNVKLRKQTKGVIQPQSCPLQRR